MTLALERFRSIPLVPDPFDHLVVPEFVPPGAFEAAVADFPEIERGGSFPLSELACGPEFQALVSELRGDALKRAVEEKFELDLTGRPTMITVRGQSRTKDGRIHTDSRTKILTALVYMNEKWTHPGGKLRLLGSPEDLDDYAVEVVPRRGTAVFFRCTENAWHGHTPYVGRRRAIQLNWVTSEAVVRREQARHGLTARLKSWLAR